MKLQNAARILTTPLLSLLLSSAVSAAGISIDTFSTQQELEDAIKASLVGPGMSITNVTYHGALGASGLFRDGLNTGPGGASTGGLGIRQGVVLTSGLAQNISNVNTSDSITGDNGLDGYAALTALIPGYETFDATVLDITFRSTGGDLYFNYVFGSEEYNEWVGSPFNDVFGFFIDGVNIALIPGSGGTPVSINNVHGGSNAKYYKDNGPGPYALEYDGFTHVFSAAARGLGTGTHHITLAIADAGDHILDSGVFIQAGTFSSTKQEDDEGHLPDDAGDDYDHNGVPDGASSLLLIALGLVGIATFWRATGRRL